MSPQNHHIFYVFFECLMCGLSLSALIFGIKYRNKFPELSHLYIYSLASLLQNSITIILSNRFPLDVKVDYYSMECFLVIEFFSIYYFFYKCSVFSRRAKILLVFLSVMFLFVNSIQFILLDPFENYLGIFLFIDSYFPLPFRTFPSATSSQSP
jgi:hypothetical protein